MLRLFSEAPAQKKQVVFSCGQAEFYPVHIIFIRFFLVYEFCLDF
jgi:hypothetical protein